jgi:hypothetical protein
MNPFDLKVALLEKHAQHPVINPHTYGVEHGPNVWLTNSKLPHLACVGRSGVITFTCHRFVIFLITIRNIARGFQSRDMHAGVLAFLETIN